MSRRFACAALHQSALTVIDWSAMIEAVLKISRVFAPTLTAVLFLIAAAVSAVAQTSPYSQWSHGPSTDPNHFPIGVWLQSPGNIQEFKNIGVNTFVGFFGDLDQTSLSQFAAGQMPLISRQNSVGLTSPQNTAIISWAQMDEPDNAQPNGSGGFGPCITPSQIVTSYNAIRANDTTRPVFLNFGRGVSDTQWIGRGSCTGQTTSYYPAAMQGGDIISYDIYPVSDSNGRLEVVASGLDNLKTWMALGGTNKIIWNFIEAAAIDGGAVPTATQLKAEVWMSLIHGSQGIMYFVHQLSPTFREDGIFNFPSVVQAVTSINAQITSLAPVLNTPTVSNAVTAGFSVSGTPLDTMVKKLNGNTYVFAVVMRNTPGTATFSGLGNISGPVQVIGENRQVTMTNGQFQDSFVGYGVHLYQFASAEVNPPTNLRAIVR